MYVQGPINDYQRQQQALIDRNYSSVHQYLLPNDRRYDNKTGKRMLPCKGAFDIGEKDVYALSDIEGQNWEFLKMLKDLGLVNIFYDNNQNAPKGAHECLTKINGELGYKKVYYTFNENACRNFQDVIVLCGDYIAHTDNDNDIKCAEGTVKILKKLNELLNNGVDKKFFLIAGNHDICSYFEAEKSQHDLKRRILNLGLYPQLLLVNGDGSKLLFQHTNFPYKEHDNYIVNKKINVNKACNLLEGKDDRNIPFGNFVPTILKDDSFFNLRYVVKNGQFEYQDINNIPQNREIYSDGGLGYDVKVIGHDTNFAGTGVRQNGGYILNVNLNNEEIKPWKTLICEKKLLNDKIPPIKPFIQDKKNTEYPKVITFGINNSYTKNIFEKAVSFFCKEKKEILKNDVKIKFYSLNQYNSFKDKLNELNNASR